MPQAVEVTNWPMLTREDEVTTVPRRNLYKLGGYIIDINSIVGVSPIITTRRCNDWVDMSFLVYLASASFILIEDNAKALRLGLIRILEATFGHIGTVDGCPF